MEDLKDALSEGVISNNVRKMLDRRRTKLNISDYRAKEIEERIKKQIQCQKE